MIRRQISKVWLIISLFILLSSSSDTKAMHSLATTTQTKWGWAWRQPPGVIVYPGEPYVAPEPIQLIWGGPDFSQLFAATTNELGLPNTPPQGIYRTSDNGYHWDYLARLEPSVNLTVLAVNPITPTTMLAGFIQYYSGQGGIYLSNNSGISWTHVLTDLWVVDLKFSPVNPNQAYALTLASGQVLVPGGLYRSDDTGQTWHFLLELVGQTLAPHPISPTVVFAGTFGGIYRSDDTGLHWDKLPGSPSEPSLIINPQRPNQMFAFGSYDDFFRSDDGGQTWMLRTSGLPHPLDVLLIQSAVIDPSDPDTIWIGVKYAGMYVSHDSGDTWEESSVGIAFLGAGIMGPQCISSAFHLNELAIACSDRVYFRTALDKSVFLPMIAQ